MQLQHSILFNNVYLILSFVVTFFFLLVHLGSAILENRKQIKTLKQKLNDSTDVYE